MLKNVSFPLVLGRFRISKSQLIVFICAAFIILGVVYLSLTKKQLRSSAPDHHGAQDFDKFDERHDYRQERVEPDHFDTEDEKTVKEQKPNPDPNLNLNTGQLVAPMEQEALVAPVADTAAPVAEKREHAAGVVGKFDDAYKNVNYSKFLGLQEQVNKMAALLAEKTEQLKRWSGWSDHAAVAEYFAVKKRLVVPLPFNWTVSQTELSELMKDKEYFNQLREAVNRTREIALKYQPIYDLNPETCTCSHTDCWCCARIFIKRLKVDVKSCLNFTYTTQGMLKTKITFDGKLAFNTDLATQDAGEICLAGAWNMTETCVQFLNVTYTVHSHRDHKTELRGCVEFHFNVQNATIASYPGGCFVTEKHDQDDKGHVNKLGNWVERK